MTVSKAKAEVVAMSLNDLLGTPTAFVAVSKKVKEAFMGPKAPKVSMTTEELKAKRNEAQRALRSTPEGKAYANAASKKSIAAKKAREAQALAELTAKLATLESPQAVTEIVAEAVEAMEAAKVEEAVEALKVPKKSSKKVKVLAEEAPL